jgi:CheY-like chemotaxis protein
VRIRRGGTRTWVVSACATARQHRPDLILIDLNLPELDGVEATRRIMDERNVPIVAFTGSAGDRLESAVEAGAVAHVAKPFVVVDLSRRLGTCWPHADANWSWTPIIITFAS